MENTGNYFVDRNNQNTLKLRELERQLPSFCTDYFIGVESRTTPLTRLNYALDAKIFFEYIREILFIQFCKEAQRSVQQRRRYK